MAARTPAAVREPPYIPGLPPDWQAVTTRLLTDPRTTPDTLLITADGLAEAAEVRRLDQFPYQASLLMALADHLRRVAPEFAR